MEVETLRESLLDPENDYLLDLGFVPVSLNGKLIALCINETVPQCFWDREVRVEFEEYTRNYLLAEWLDLPLLLYPEQVWEMIDNATHVSFGKLK